MNPTNKIREGPLPRFTDQEKTVLACTLLFLVILFVYRTELANGFTNLDDPEYVTANPRVQHGFAWNNLLWIFHNPDEAFNWYPLTWLTHMLDYRLFGLNAWGHHLTSVLLHCANAVVLFVVLKRITGSFWRSLVAAALFGLHPLHVESVAWVAERKDVLSTLFWLLTMWAYACYAMEAAPERRGGRYVLALGFFILGLMSKAMLVSLPCALLLLDYWPLGRFKQKQFGALLMEKAPFFLLAAAASVVAFIVQRGGGAVISTTRLPIAARVANALVSYSRYIGKTFWPVNLAVFYPHPVYWPATAVILSALLIAGISLAVLTRRTASPYLPVGWFWFAGTLAPVIGLVQVGAQAMADRYSYVSSIGLFIMAAWGTEELTRRVPNRARVCATVAVIALLACSAATRRQIGYWKDSGTLFQHAIEVTHDNYFAELHLADYMVEEGQMDAALAVYTRLVDEHPCYVDALSSLGALLVREGRFEAATNVLQRAVKLNPGDTETRDDFGVALGETGHAEEAIDQLEQSIRIDPANATAHRNLGILLAEKGRRAEAIGELAEALKLQPELPGTRLPLQSLTTSGTNP